MDKYYINVHTKTTIEQLEVPNECKVLWNDGYMSLFPDEGKIHIQNITHMIYEKLGNNWFGWTLGDIR